MNPHLEPHVNTPLSVRANIAAELLRFYGADLAGAAEFTPPPRFSLSRLLRAQMEGRGHLPEHEKGICGSAAVGFGQQLDPQRAWVPINAMRTMGTTPGAKGGYLVGVDTASPVDVLRPWSVTASAGALILPGLRDGVMFPKVGTATTAAWIDEAGNGESGTPPSESPPLLGGVSLVPRTAIATIKFSVQLLKQAEAADPFLNAQLLGAVGELLDAAVLAGVGGKAPQGLLSTPGIGTQSGSSLAHAGTLAMRRNVLAAGGREDGLQWFGAPGVQETLGARNVATNAGRFLWDDDGILGKPAHATKNAPASTLIVGDFGTVVVGIFGPGIQITVDPSQDFNRAGLVARVLLFCDVAFLQPSGFCVATSVT